MIKLIDLTKKFGAFTAVDNINLEIKQGQIMVFLGVNGAGKTTTIKMMTGVIQPTAGSVLIGGFDIRREPESAKRLFGVIPDRPHLFTKLTGREFLAFMADIYGVPADLREERIEALLETYGMSDSQDDLIEGYSHGMKQRLMMCGAQVHDPPVLIIDEPMVGLDPRGARMLKKNLRRQAAAGKTIFISTHSLSAAEEVADQLAIIEQGRLLVSGTLQELYAFSNAKSLNLEQIFLDIVGSEDTNLD